MCVDITDVFRASHTYHVSSPGSQSGFIWPACILRSSPAGSLSRPCCPGHPCFCQASSFLYSFLSLLLDKEAWPEVKVHELQGNNWSPLTIVDGESYLPLILFSAHLLHYLPPFQSLCPSHKNKNKTSKPLSLNRYFAWKFTSRKPS